MGATLLSPWRAPDPAERAAALPYASLAVDTQGNRGLLVMAYQAGENGRDTFWQAADFATLQLRDGRPVATDGFEATLLGSWLVPLAPPYRYRLHAHWQDRDGREHRDVAMARLECDGPRPVELPLMRKPLERCVERLRWQGGERGTNVLWRDPDTGRLWAGEISLWPDGQRLAWRVARPWTRQPAPAPGS
ncbi:YjbF family lipoprotein [Halomonas denitrificans]|uniref:YjbF family lipoprotein n=1 Tax=Halomonas denitrificans TaxID=370769 RepID=UPI001300B6CF|nr:YjbF family lipoprotein [Halomonas denitrificans]